MIEAPASTEDDSSPNEDPSLPPSEPDNTDLPIPKQHHAALPPPFDGVTAPIPPKPRVPHPTLRYDADAIALRQRRMLGRPHGGTVVVHYLKRSEWLSVCAPRSTSLTVCSLETAVALLGRERTWDSGYPFTPLSTVESPAMGFGAVSVAPVWDGTGVVELAAGRWGAARMYGSPIVGEDGSISEGRPVVQPKRPLMPAPGSSSSSPGSSSALDRLSAGHLYADPVDGPNFDLNNAASSSSAIPASASSSSSLSAVSSASSAASASASSSASSSTSQPSESASAVAP